MLTRAAKIAAAADFIQRQWSTSPRAGIILGSGLGNFAAQVQSAVVIPYQEIPHFPASTALGHKGQLVCGSVAGVPVLTMQGRFHVYEGHGIENCTLPVQVMKRLGAQLLIASNASGGLNPLYDSGDIMVIDDHINLMFQNPLIGVNDDELGPRFPDMSAPYDRQLIEQAIQIARRHDFTAHRGVYAALTGPNYETRAEYRYLRQIGADVVGMSTVPEVIVAVHAGMRVLALSAVTNVCRPDTLGDTSGAEVVQAAELAEPKMTQIVLGILQQLGR